MPESFRARAILAVALTTALAVALRWDAIAIVASLNADEGEILASGRRAAMKPWLPMSTASANTYFPLWPSFLGALDAMGMPMTIRFAHALSALLTAGILSMVWVGTARRWGWLLTAAFLAPGAWALLTRDPDFWQLNTELPPVFLLVVAALIAFPSDKVVRSHRLASAVAIASLAPWFKPQAGPLAVAVVLAACLFCYLCRDHDWDRREWWRRAAWLAAGGLGPSACLVGLMLVGGTFHLFWQEPVGFLTAYLSHSVGDLGVGVETASIGAKVSSLMTHFLDHWVVVLWGFVGARGVWLMQRDSSRGVLAGLAVWALPVVAALFTLLVQWPIFPHYLLFLYASTGIAAIAGSALPRDERASSRGQALVPVFHDMVARRRVLITALAILALLSATSPAIEVGRNDRRVSAVSNLCGPGTSVFVWGWAAELYAYYDWQPASRYVTYALLRARTPHQQAYRSRFLDEMRSRPPECVLSAVGDLWFRPPGMDVADLERELPSIQPMLRECYARHEVDARAPTALVLWKRAADC